MKVYTPKAPEGATPTRTPGQAEHSATPLLDTMRAYGAAWAEALRTTEQEPAGPIAPHIAALTAATLNYAEALNYDGTETAALLRATLEDLARALTPEPSSSTTESPYSVPVDGVQLLVLDPCNLDPTGQEYAAELVRLGLAVPIGTTADGRYTVETVPAGVLIRGAGFSALGAEMQVGPSLGYTDTRGTYQEAEYDQYRQTGSAA